ncbi:MAG: phosphatase PAP2 family protein [Ferrovum sp.]|nr:phosphatase PAP2 family protein [Ferrovum sp.]
MGFVAVFFSLYVFLLKHPSYPITFIPSTPVDQLIGVEPWTLPVYLSLWLYVSLPAMLMTTKQEIIEYGLWMSGLCLAGLVIFYFYPTAVPPTNIDWTRYPSLAFMKKMDAAGNACPSLHVATATAVCIWLHRRLPLAELGPGAVVWNLLWWGAIVYSTMATKQHMVLDVVAGIALALVFVRVTKKSLVPRNQKPCWPYDPEYPVFPRLGMTAETAPIKQVMHDK